jgi:hypothetical protein
LYYLSAGFLLLLLWNPDFKPMALQSPIGFFLHPRADRLLARDPSATTGFG